MVLAIVSMFFISCQKNEPYATKKTFFRMDTVIDITLALGNNETVKKQNVLSFWKLWFSRRAQAAQIETVWQKIDSLLADWEVRFSPSHERSEIRQLNQTRANSMMVSPILAEILAKGIQYGDTLNGMFDITISPIKELWGFNDIKVENEEIPSPEDIQSALAQVDYRKVQVVRESQRVTLLDTNIVIDIGGIAKGFALRELGKLLNSLGFPDYLVVAGGDIIARGRRPGGTAWRIGIQHPRRPEKPLALFQLDSGSIVTSGDYERFRIIKGQRYHHLFDPRTGYSSTKNQSLTIWGMDPITVDILSTGLFSLPADSIIAFIEKRPLLECLVVDSAGQVFSSQRWRKKIRFL